ncbi:MAG: type III PLP-dependent enzyme [Nitrospirota bacterium]
MQRAFHIEDSHRSIVAESTLSKVIDYVSKSGEVTPYLVMDSEKIAEKASTIGKKIRNSIVFYAVKANPDIEVLRLINKLGLGFEIASEGELQILSDLGVSPERIISSNPLKTLKFLKLATSYGVNYFSYDSHSEVDKLSKYAPGSNVYIRLSVPNEGSEWPLSKKFGVEMDDAVELLINARDRGLNPVGVTFHVGSQCTNAYSWHMALDKTKDLWDIAAQNGIKLSMINIGGGYPIRYKKNVVDIATIDKDIDKIIYREFPSDTRIFIEPGRAVVGDSGIFVATVIGKARRADEDWLYIDVGVFNGLMESVGGIKYSYIFENNVKKKIWTLAGPSCDSFDVIETGVELPDPDIGSYVLILSGGAYTISYASEFNGFSIPKTILI